MERSLMINPFPHEEFDAWADSYDTSITTDQFPFWGYQEVLSRMTALAGVQAGMSVLDLGTGTGKLAARFSELGCELWCTDFSAVMLEKARHKLPRAHFLLHDLRMELPAGWNRPFDRIVSAYVFHHFEMDEKVRILRGLSPYLAPGGRMVIGDIAFRDQAALDQVRVEAGADWEQEFYWLADEALRELGKAGLPAQYLQISSCAGILVICI
jgi:putative AdoMet-dependent methyltransferase